MKTAFESKPWTVLKLDWDLMFVSKYEYHRGGRGATTIKMRLKNLMNWTMTDRVFNWEDKLDDVILDRSKFDYLYNSWDSYFFMSQTTFEQIELHEDDVWDLKYFLTEWIQVDLQQFEWKFVWLIVPSYVTLEVTECEPWVKWNTADWKIIKEATVSTGLILKVPGFIEQWDKIVINTDTFEYLERSKS